MDDFLLLLISFLLLAFIRLIMSLSVLLALSKKAWKNYKLTVKGLDRWFMWSAPKLVKEKYSRYEIRRINYPAVISTYRALNVLLHICFILLVITYILVFSSLLDHVIIRPAFIMYLIVVGVCFFAVCVAELYVNWRFHKSRYRLK